MQIAGVALAMRLPWLVFALQAGALADRLDRRRTMTLVNLARAAVIGGLAAVIALGSEALWLLYAVAFVLGIGETLFDTAAQSMLPVIVSRADLSAANGRLNAAETTMNRFVGPPAGGLLVGVTMALAFVGSAATYLCGAAAIALLAGRFRTTRGEGPPTRLRSDIAEGLRYLAGHRLLRTMAVMVGVTNLSVMATLAVLPVYAVEPGPMGLSAIGFGLLLTGMAVGSVVGALSAPYAEQRLGRARTLAFAVATAALVCAAPLLTRPILVGTAFAVAGIGEMFWDVITVSLRQRITPDHLIGRVNAGYRLVGYGTMPLGAALGGVLGQVVDLRWVFAAGAVIILTLLLGLRIVTDEAMDAAEAGDSTPPERLG